MRLASNSALVTLAHVEHVMGTTVSFDVRVDTTRVSSARDAVAQAIEWLHQVDEIFSTYKPMSDISRLGRGEVGIDACHPEVRMVLALCSECQRETGGYFTARYAGHIDPTGLVKGWAIARAGQLLARQGIRHVLVNGGGDIWAQAGKAGDEPWQIGIVHPTEPGAYAAVLRLFSCAVATSGVSQRGAHIVDPFTGRPATTWASATIVGPDLVRADAYATAALAMGEAAPRWLATLGTYEALLIRPDGTGWWSDGFPSLCTTLNGPSAEVLRPAGTPARRVR
ncbi:MAG: FAD:protein FMN transferase [Acidothermus sp.]|nr:FAD:protein FMN transferase [Acidothermus sp.]